MARYIDAEQLFKEIELLDAEFGNDNSSFVEQGDVLDAIDSCETADVVSKADYDMLEAKLNFVKDMLGDIAQYGEGLYQNAVKVYCKDCKHYKLLKCPLGNKTKSYDFCSLGEMKEESEGKYIENGRT